MIGIFSQNNKLAQSHANNIHRHMDKKTHTHIHTQPLKHTRLRHRMRASQRGAPHPPVE